MTRDGPRPLVVGIGNRYRGDDAVAGHVLDALATAELDVDAVELSGEPTRLVEAWRDRDRVVVVDAVRTGSPAGTVHRLEWDRLETLTSEATPMSWHEAGLAAAVALAKQLDLVPESLVVIGVEPARVTLGADLSDEVRRALPEVLAQVVEVLDSAVRALPSD